MKKSKLQKNKKTQQSNKNNCEEEYIKYSEIIDDIKDEIED